MPEGPLGTPRLTNIGPLSRSTEEELSRSWKRCPPSGKPSKICEEIKITAITILEGQGFYTECDTLEEINSGGCASVAKRVYKQVDGVNVMAVGDRDHVWIEYDDKHYDAEVPTGVSDPLDFPFFMRIPPRFILDNMEMVMEKEAPERIEDAIFDITDEIEQEV